MDTYKRNKASSIQALLLAELRRNEGVQEPCRRLRLNAGGSPLMKETWHVCPHTLFLINIHSSIYSASYVPGPNSVSNFDSNITDLH